MIYLGVIGASECDYKVSEIAYLVGKAIAESGSVMICGGMGGVMEAASRGVKDAGGISIGLLPGENRIFANPYLTYSIPTGIGEARNSIVVRSSDALIAVDGSYGTLSEIAYALKWGKPVAGLGTWRIQEYDGTEAPIVYFSEPQEAEAWALRSLRDGSRRI